MHYAISNSGTGAVWGSTVHGLCLANGVAFIAVNSVDLSPYAGTEGSATRYFLEIQSSNGYKAWGWVGAADAGAALGAELVADGDMSNAGSWTAGTGWAVAGSVATKTAGTASDLEQTIVLTAGKLYKLVYTITRTAGTVTAKVGGSYWASRNAANTYTEYICTAGSPAKVVFSADAAFAGTVDTVSVKEVTHVAATGVHIVSAKNGSTRNWMGTETSFTYNDTSYALAVYDSTSFVWKGNHHVGTDPR